MAGSPLLHRHILVVEDEYLIAMSLQDALERSGSVVVGPFPSVEKALKALEASLKIDAAVLDVNLGGKMVYPVADALLARHIPFVFTSGYEDSDLRQRYPHAKNCLKPYLLPDIEKVLADALMC